MQEVSIVLKLRNIGPRNCIELSASGVTLMSHQARVSLARADLYFHLSEWIEHT